jgi:hypothetical protein
MSNIVNDEYPSNKGLSDQDLKAKLAAEYTFSAAPQTEDTKNDFPTEIIDLPSKGWFYPEGHPLASGKIELKYMTAKEEDILSSQNLIKQGVVIDKLLQSLIVTKVKYDDILLCDKNAIFVAARILAYGPDYEVEITCPNCGEKSKNHIDLQQFDEKDVDFSHLPKHKNAFPFTLPGSKKTITFGLLTHGDEKNIAEDVKKNKKFTKLVGVDPELSTRLKYIIKSVEGDDSQATINKFVDNMLSRDSLAFRTYLKEITPDIDTTFEFACPHCDYVQEKMAMPITVGFFWVGV